MIVKKGQTNAIVFPPLFGCEGKALIARSLFPLFKGKTAFCIFIMISTMPILKHKAASRSARRLVLPGASGPASSSGPFFPGDNFLVL